MKARGKVLLIDDQRTLPADVIARTYDQGVQALEEGNIRRLLLDHDLADLDPKKTGYGIILLLEECEEMRPEAIHLVTANPVGKLNMEAALTAMGYTFYPPTADWHRPASQKEISE
jgi:hypothetical protein